jgi:hypothetical protein
MPCGLMTINGKFTRRALYGKAFFILSKWTVKKTE